MKKSYRTYDNTLPYRTVAWRGIFVSFYYFWTLNKWLSILLYLFRTQLNYCIRDSVLFWPLDPGSGMVFPGSRIPDSESQTHIFESLMTIFGVKSSLFLCKSAQFSFFYSSIIRVIFNFVIFVATKIKVWQQIFLPLSLVAVLGSRLTIPDTLHCLNHCKT
jgi:hypothetical protein